MLAIATMTPQDQNSLITFQIGENMGGISFFTDLKTFFLSFSLPIFYLLFWLINCILFTVLELSYSVT